MQQKLASHFGVDLPEQGGLDTLSSIQAASRGEVDAALIMGGNLYAATPNSNWAQQALDSIGFKLYLTTTMNLGHVHGVDNSEALILPVTARDEEWQPTTQESMFNYVRMSDGGIDRLDNIRPEMHILCELAKQLVPDCPIDFETLKNHATVREAIAAILPGMEALAEIDVSKKEFHIGGRIKHTPTFKQPDGKAEFKVNRLPALTSQNDDATYTLMTIRSEGQFNSMIYEEHDSYRSIDTRWSVMMNVDDMQSMGIAERDRVTLKSDAGEMHDVAVFPFDIPSGNLMAYYPEANVLAGLQVDPISKTPAFKSIQVCIDKTK